MPPFVDEPASREPFNQNARHLLEISEAVGAIERLFDHPDEFLALVIITAKDGRKIHGAIVPAKWKNDELSIPSVPTAPQRIASIANEMNKIKGPNDQDRLYRFVFFDDNKTNEMGLVFNRCQGFVERSLASHEHLDELPTWIYLHDIHSKYKPAQSEPTLFAYDDPRLPTKTELSHGIVVTSFILGVGATGMQEVFLSDGSTMEIAFTGTGCLEDGLCRNYTVQFMKSFKEAYNL